MKHVYPIRHPASLDAAPQGPSSASRAESTEPALPQERDESSHSQAQAAPQQKDVGRQALRNATDGSADTDRGPVMDQIYNDTLAPRRGAVEPRR